ncbi:MAG: hypothetical protein AABZ31_07710, partial [Bdellovibrionota bacterium]
GIGEAKFSQAELDRLAEEDTYGHQAVSGVKWGTAAVATVGLIFGTRKHGPGVLQGLKNIWRAAPEAASAAKAKAKAVTQLTLHEAMQMARQSGVRFASDLGTNVVEIVTRRNKLSRLKAWGVNFAKSEAFSDMAWVALGQGVGAASMTGFHALHKAFFKENMKNGIVNPNAIRDEYFDGLTVLRLTCQVKDLFPKTLALTQKPVSDATATELKTLYKTLLNSYADYMYLKGATGRFITPTPLSPNIKHNTATGRVSFKTKIRGETQEFGFDCHALKGVKTHGRPLEVSFGEMLDELTGSFLNLESVSFKLQK